MGRVSMQGTHRPDKISDGYRKAGTTGGDRSAGWSGLTEPYPDGRRGSAVTPARDRPGTPASDTRCASQWPRSATHRSSPPTLWLSRVCRLWDYLPRAKIDKLPGRRVTQPGRLVVAFLE